MKKRTSIRNYISSILLITILGIFTGCSSDHTHTYTAQDFEGPLVPEWAINANIYEVNIRQYSPEGTFNAFAEDLPRLNEMGVKILWLMPIHPIGEKNRKGSLGSYYSVQDYTGINPSLAPKKILEILLKALRIWV